VARSRIDAVKCLSVPLGATPSMSGCESRLTKVQRGVLGLLLDELQHFTLDAGSQRDGSSLPVASNAYLGLTSSRNTAVVATALFIQPSSPHNPQDEQASDYGQGKQGNCVEGHIESFATTAARLDPHYERDVTSCLHAARGGRRH
jgi:hypothetical protein